ncbi:MAG: hypothetical protein QXN68_00810 [Thermoplasmata archaeon]
MEKVDIKLGLKSWEGKVKDWKQCVDCGEEWTPISLKDGICPDCRKGIRLIYSKFIKEVYEAWKISDFENEVLIKIIESNLKELNNEENLLRCGICSSYELFLISSEFGICCAICYEKKKHYKRIQEMKDKETKTNERRVNL